MKQLVKTLTETFSPSGYETGIREVIRRGDQVVCK